VYSLKLISNVTVTLDPEDDVQYSLSTHYTTKNSVTITLLANRA